MSITMTELKNNLSKYIALSLTEDIYITQYGKVVSKLTNPFQSRMELAASLFGILPDVDECVHCGSLKVSAFSAKEGGFLCEDCARRLNVPLRPALDLKRLRLAVKAGMKHYEEAAGAAQSFHAELQDLIAVLQQHAGIEIRSFSFYNRLFDH